MANVVDVTEAEVQSICQSILTRYGIDFTCYEPKSLKRRIIRVLNNQDLSSIHELWVKFLRDPKFVYTFMNEISVGMTSMFRDPVLWKNLKERIERDYVAKPLLNIWHAGCSTGEEVFSMGILLKEINMLQKALAVATDFNQDAIAIAQLGVYHKIRMIENENNYKSYNSLSGFDRYYKKDNTECAMDLGLINHVKFSYQNLITDPVPFPGLFDIIFCRNVMIYFDTKAKEDLLIKFYNALKPGGYFMIGFFDTMNYLINNDRFELVDDQAKIFVRR